MVNKLEFFKIGGFQGLSYLNLGIIKKKKNPDL